jgi:hypothetical protein
VRRLAERRYFASGVTGFGRRVAIASVVTANTVLIERITVRLLRQTLKRHLANGLSAQDVARALAKQNIVLPEGFKTTGSIY